MVISCVAMILALPIGIHALVWACMVSIFVTQIWKISLNVHRITQFVVTSEIGLHNF